MASRLLWPLGLLLLGALWAQPSGPPPAKVVLDPARVEVLESLRQVTGELRASRVTVLAAKQPGLVTSADFFAGDPVAADQVLAQQDDLLASLAVELAAADLEVRQKALARSDAEVTKARRDLARAEELAARSMETERVRDDAKTLLEVAVADLEQRKAEIAVARVKLSQAEEIRAELTVKAPFAAVVASKETEVGQWLRPGDAVAELFELTTVEVRLDVPEHLLASVSRPDLRVKLRFPGIEGESGEVDNQAGHAITSVVPRADPLSRTFPVRIRVDNPTGLLRPGMSVVGLIPTGQSAPVTTVHKDAILRDDAGEFLYFDGGGRAAVARVETLYAVGNRVAVRSPMLQDGTSVIVEGNERVFPGQPLLVTGGGGTEGEK